MSILENNIKVGDSFFLFLCRINVKIVCTENIREPLLSACVDYCPSQDLFKIITQKTHKSLLFCMCMLYTYKTHTIFIFLINKLKFNSYSRLLKLNFINQFLLY